MQTLGNHDRYSSDEAIHFPGPANVMKNSNDNSTAVYTTDIHNSSDDTLRALRLIS